VKVSPSFIPHSMLFILNKITARGHLCIKEFSLGLDGTARQRPMLEQVVRPATNREDFKVSAKPVFRGAGLFVKGGRILGTRGGSGTFQG
jgi:hypothetical protein